MTDIMIHIHGVGKFTAPDWETMKKILREHPDVAPSTAEWIIAKREEIMADKKKNDRYPFE